MSNSSFKVAAIQMVSGTQLASNLESAARLVAQAAAKGVQLVLLPEYFCLMGQDDQAKVRIREPHDQGQAAGPIQHFLSNAAKQHGIWLVGGTIPLAANDSGKVLNTTLVFNPQGQEVGRYDKIHLFGFKKGEESYNESETIERGNQVGFFDAPVGRVGLSVCYDLRFPELYRAMSKDGIHPVLILMPAAFTYTTGSAHWEVLLRARAIENQCYVLASAQGGKHENGRRTWGHSMLIDPWGQIIEQLPEGEGMVIGDIDLSRLKDIREQLPALAHRLL
ncbi:carbon-nitrogen hydrolase family protein [Ampullimonas aquatilis]|uniref:carbon-nitrogen hydrolase family protein n=1 Tax=Ampullimonas aquatilis TaxID=1341549 RepID=UPI003C70F449